MAVRRFTLSLLLFLTLAWVFPSAAMALGVAGFDVSRAGVKNPDSAFHFDLKPGESLEERIIIRNNTTDTVQRLRIYSADGTPATNGGVALKERQDEMTGLAKWIKIDADELIELEPRESRTIWFKLSVPESSDSREDVAGIVVERAEAIKDNSDKQFAVNLLPRVAILVTQRLPGPSNAKLDIVNFGRINELWSSPVLFGLTLKNTGNVLVRPTGKVDLFNVFGRKSDSIKLSRLSTIFPGRTDESQFQWEDTPPLGYFTAKISVEYDKGKATTTRAQVLILPWWLIFIVFPLWLIARQARQRRGAKQIGDKARTGQEAQEAMKTFANAVEEIEASTTPEPMGAARATAMDKDDDAKTDATATAVEAPPKKRGRPPKKKTEEAGEAVATPKKRGRPPKKKVDEAAATVEAAPKKRGRPPKKKTEGTGEAVATPKKRGRPPKKKVDDAAAAQEKPKKRGRPPKKKEPTED